MVAYRGGNYWTLFPPLIWKVLHAVLHIIWLESFFVALKESTNERAEDTETGLLFNEEQIEFFPNALSEIINDEHFEKIHQLITRKDARTAQSIFDHGLYGAQLQWKLSNINYWARRFIEQRTAALFEKLLLSIDTLLDSLLGAVPGGSAIKELKDAVLNSVTLLTR